MSHRRCEHGMLEGMCAVQRCTHWDGQRSQRAGYKTFHVCKDCGRQGSPRKNGYCVPCRTKKQEAQQ